MPSRYPALQLLAATVLITVCGSWHLIAKAIVAAGYGSMAIALIFASLPFLSRYLD